MSKIAFLFPGQGSQTVGMGTSLVQVFPAVKELFEQANQFLGWDLLATCREGPEDHLRQTQIAQPALYVTGYATYRVMQSIGIHPEAVAGHSIGEYAALAAANVFSYVDGLTLVKERAHLMQQAASEKPGRMMAILGLTGEQVSALCHQAQSKGVCVAVNFNSPEQTVIAGSAAALEETERLAMAQGAKRIVSLNVSGAFHSPLMASAARGLRRHLDKVVFKKASIPVAMNADGQLHTTPDDIRMLLEQQLDHPVMWALSIQVLKSQGFTTYIECGAGRVLTGLLRRIDRDLQGYDTDNVKAIQEVGEALGASRKGSV